LYHDARIHKRQVQSFSVTSQCQMHSSVLYIIVNKTIVHHFYFASFCNYEERCSNMNRQELAYVELHL